MNLEQADKIRMDWAKFLENTHGNLMILFMTKIPESLLPFPKEKIEEALSIISNHFKSINNIEAISYVEASLIYLDLYTNDKESINDFVQRYNKNGIDAKIYTAMSEAQEKIFKDLIENYR